MAAPHAAATPLPPGRLRVTSSDPQHAVDVVSRLYCPHEITLRGSRRLSLDLEVLRPGVQPIVSLRYGAPVRINAGRFDDLMLVMHCTAGSARVRQGRSATSLLAGETLPLSPSEETRLTFDEHFAQRSMRVSIPHVEALCARHLQRPLDRPLKFDLQPFCPSLKLAWTQGLDLILDLDRTGAVLPDAAAARIDEFMLSLMLHLHPHNHSEQLRAPRARASSRAVREADHMMRTAPAGAPLTVSKIAAAVGVSVRGLEAGFREWRQTTPTQYFRRVRLEAAREALAAAEPSRTVSSVALDHGFPHLSRFAAYYRKAFGEHPRQTLARARVVPQEDP